ncbi:AAA family ATPase [Hymenobacter canadensis]|uniref:DUF3696 domain-containing protein n=1 Tax=Hymenobacter canadensis TaxID=2999067 RepID=A0ABY7LJT2_9BACT|nr:DUF3696 domain-containing protein [Hymenobacter canadensis]WBA40700.1 DUF3696 domain-containing protein [Hymenobacter canadensis]
MINNIRIQHFKSWQDTGTIELGSLTGFFGTNSSGKTSILQFILMLKQTIESSDRSRILNLGGDNSYIDLGTLYDVIHAHADPGIIEFSMQWPFQRVDYGRFDGKNIKVTLEDVTFSATIQRKKDRIFVDCFSFKGESWQVGMKRKSRVAKSNKLQYYIESKELEKGKNKSSKIESIEPEKFYGFPFSSSQATKFGGFRTMDLIYSFERLFKSIYYLGPLREYPSRLYVWAGEQPADVGTRGEKAVAALLASRQGGSDTKIKRENITYTVEQSVAFWLKELGLIHSFKVQPIAPNRKEYEVRVQRTPEAHDVFITDVGFGVSQILPVLVLCYYVPINSTIILEQPEIHLHPAVQAGLADVFIDVIKYRNLQIILESHSEHLLQRLQRRIAEEAIDPSKIKLNFSSFTESSSSLTALQLDEYGNIKNWPLGFFGDVMGDATAMVQAESKRKKAKKIN